jgi:hypothetical protein
VFETLAEDDPDDAPSTRLAAMSAAARDT